MGDHHEARMFHDQTYLTSGWHVGMCIMAKNGDPHELESVWSDRLVSSPNPSYQVKLGEGPSSIGNQWAGFTLVHYAVWRYYNNQTGADSAAHYIEALRNAGCAVDCVDVRGRRAADLDADGRFRAVLHDPDEDAIGCASCFACVPPPEYGSDDHLRMHAAGDMENHTHVHKVFKKTGQYS